MIGTSFGFVSSSHVRLDGVVRMRLDARFSTCFFLRPFLLFLFIFWRKQSVLRTRVLHDPSRFFLYILSFPSVCVDLVVLVVDLFSVFVSSDLMMVDSSMSKQFHHSGPCFVDHGRLSQVSFPFAGFVVGQVLMTRFGMDVLSRAGDFEPVFQSAGCFELGVVGGESTCIPFSSFQSSTHGCFV